MSVFNLWKCIEAYTYNVCSSVFVYYASTRSSKICIQKTCKKTESIGEKLLPNLPSTPSSLFNNQWRGERRNHSHPYPGHPFSPLPSPALISLSWLAWPERGQQTFLLSWARPENLLCRPRLPSCGHSESVLRGRNRKPWLPVVQTTFSGPVLPATEVLFSSPIPMLASISQLISKMEGEEEWLIITPYASVTSFSAVKKWQQRINALLFFYGTLRPEAVSS